jgi:hypothetical protein
LRCAKYSIDVAFAGRQRTITAGPIDFTPAGQAVRARVPIPDILTRLVRVVV